MKSNWKSTLYEWQQWSRHKDNNSETSEKIHWTNQWKLQCKHQRMAAMNNHSKLQCKHQWFTVTKALFGSSPAPYNTGADGAPVLQLQKNALRAAPLRPLQEQSCVAEGCRTRPKHHMSNQLRGLGSVLSADAKVTRTPLVHNEEIFQRHRGSRLDAPDAAYEVKKSTRTNPPQADFQEWFWNCLCLKV